MPLGDALEIAKHAKVNELGEIDFYCLVVALMKCALKEDGARLFGAHQEQTLLEKTEFDVVLKLITKMGVLARVIGASVEKKT